MNESIGAALRAGREQRRLTLAQVADATRIRAHYLQALENDDLSAMPSAAQGRGFMRIYAQFLNLDLDALIPPAPPPTLAGPEASTTPASTATPAPENAAAPAHESAPPPGLLSSLRDRVGRRLRPAADPKEAPGPDADPNDKKKARR